MPPPHWKSLGETITNFLPSLLALFFLLNNANPIYYRLLIISFVWSEKKILKWHSHIIFALLISLTANDLFFCVVAFMLIKNIIFNCSEFLNDLFIGIPKLLLLFFGFFQNRDANLRNCFYRCECCYLISDIIIKYFSMEFNKVGLFTIIIIPNYDE